MSLESDLAATLIDVLEAERREGIGEDGELVHNGDPPTWRVMVLFKPPIMEYRAKLEKSIGARESEVVTYIEWDLIETLAEYTCTYRRSSGGKIPRLPNDELIRKFTPHIVEYTRVISDREELIALLRGSIAGLNGHLNDLCPDVGW